MYTILCPARCFSACRFVCVSTDTNRPAGGLRSLYMPALFGCSVCPICEQCWHDLG